MVDTRLIQNRSTEFIPHKKKTLTNRRKYYNAPFIFSIIILFATIGLWGGLLFYIKTLQTEKTQAEIQLDNVNKSIASSEIEDLQKLDLRLTTVSELLDKHVNIAPFLSLIEDNTLTNTIHFSNLSLTVSNEIYKVSMDGTADNFESLGYQAKIFNQNPSFQNVVFSNFTINEEDGSVSFSVEFSLNPELISYKLQKSVGIENISTKNSEQ